MDDEKDWSRFTRFATPDWFVQTSYGDYTLRQEIFCWRYAWHGVGTRAYREAYTGRTLNRANQGAIKYLNTLKIVKRIESLISQHHAGEIDLEAGPWEHYKIPEGIGEKDRSFPKRLTYAHLGGLVILPKDDGFGKPGS